MLAAQDVSAKSKMTAGRNEAKLIEVWNWRPAKQRIVRECDPCVRTAGTIQAMKRVKMMVIKMRTKSLRELSLKPAQAFDQRRDPSI